MPAIPQLKSCCFCLTTETGTKVIAWICTIGGILETLGALSTLVSMLGHKHTGSDVFEAAVGVVIAALLLLLGLHLLLGVYKGNQAYVRLWVNCSVIYLIFLVVMFCIRIILMFLGRGGFDLLYYIINIVLAAYCILVVNSYLREQGSGVEAF